MEIMQSHAPRRKRGGGDGSDGWKGDTKTEAIFFAVVVAC